MAIYSAGAVATDIRGSIAGNTFSRNKGGLYMRARVSPVQPKTPKQLAVRNQFALNSKVWSGTLTDSQRQAWTFFAQANPLVNVLGASIIVSGLAMMMKLNQRLAQIGMPAITDPPVDMSVPALAAVTGITSDHTGPNVKLLTDTQAVVADAAYYIFATGSMAPGKTPQPNQLRFMGAFPGVAAAVDVDFATPYVAAFGSPTTGQRVMYYAATINTATGAITPPLAFSIVTGP